MFPSASSCVEACSSCVEACLLPVAADPLSLVVSYTTASFAEPEKGKASPIVSEEQLASNMVMTDNATPSPSPDVTHEQVAKYDADVDDCDSSDDEVPLRAIHTNPPACHPATPTEPCNTAISTEDLEVAHVLLYFSRQASFEGSAPDKSTGSFARDREASKGALDHAPASPSRSGLHACPEGSQRTAACEAVSIFVDGTNVADDESHSHGRSKQRHGALADAARAAKPARVAAQKRRGAQLSSIARKKRKRMQTGDVSDESNATQHIDDEMGHETPAERSCAPCRPRRSAAPTDLTEPALDDIAEKPTHFVENAAGAQQRRGRELAREKRNSGTREDSRQDGRLGGGSRAERQPQIKEASHVVTDSRNGKKRAQAASRAAKSGADDGGPAIIQHNIDVSVVPFSLAPLVPKAKGSGLSKAGQADEVRVHTLVVPGSAASVQVRIPASLPARRPFPVPAVAPTHKHATASHSAQAAAHRKASNLQGAARGRSRLPHGSKAAALDSEDPAASAPEEDMEETGAADGQRRVHAPSSRPPVTVARGKRGKRGTQARSGKKRSVHHHADGRSAERRSLPSAQAEGRPDSAAALPSARQRAARQKHVPLQALLHAQRSKRGRVTSDLEEAPPTKRLHVAGTEHEGFIPCSEHVTLGRRASLEVQRLLDQAAEAQQPNAEVPEGDITHSLAEPVDPLNVTSKTYEDIYEIVRTRLQKQHSADVVAFIAGRRSDRVSLLPGESRARKECFKRFITRILNNDAYIGECAGRVLRLKPDLDLETSTFEIEMVLEALRYNCRVEALYIHNFEEGFTDHQLNTLLDLLHLGRIWAVNVGENFKVSRTGWKTFLARLPQTCLAYTYVSEAHLRGTGLKVKMRAAIRINRILSPMRDAVVCKHITNMWFNPSIPLHKGRHYGAASKAESLALSRQAMPTRDAWKRRIAEVQKIRDNKARFLEYCDTRTQLLAQRPKRSRPASDAAATHQFDSVLDPDADHDTRSSTGHAVHVNIVPHSLRAKPRRCRRRDKRAQSSEAEASNDAAAAPAVEVLDISDLPRQQCSIEQMQLTRTMVEDLILGHVTELGPLGDDENEEDGAPADLEDGLNALGLNDVAGAAVDTPNFWNEIAAQRRVLDKTRLDEQANADIADEVLAWAVRCEGGNQRGRQRLRRNRERALLGKRIDIFLPFFLQWVAAEVLQVQAPSAATPGWVARVRFWNDEVMTLTLSDKHLTWRFQEGRANLPKGLSMEHVTERPVPVGVQC